MMTAGSKHFPEDQVKAGASRKMGRARQGCVSSQPVSFLFLEYPFSIFSTKNLEGRLQATRSCIYFVFVILLLSPWVEWQN
jgi:hypothetical protein